MGSCVKSAETSRKDDIIHGRSKIPEIVELNESNGKGELTLDPSLFVQEQKGRFKDSYVMGERLGNGAFGEVRQCINRITGHV